MKKYLHIGFGWNGPAKTEAINKLITKENVADDWFSYGGNCWIVYTTYSQNAWVDYLRPHIGDSTLLICEVTNLPSSNGVLNVSLWEWFNRFRPNV